MSDAEKLIKIEDPEYLAAIADEVAKNYDTERELLLSEFLPSLSPQQKALYTKLDDLAIAELCDVQQQTVNKTANHLLTGWGGASVLAS